jgi:hypothetical protein
MTTPDIFATGYSESASAFLNSPGGQGCPDVPVRATATIAAASASGTVVGLIPFNKGASLEMSGVFTTADLDTGTDVTFELGYVYDDNTTYTNDPNAFIASNTGLQSAAANVVFDGTGGVTFEAEADGWIALTTGGGATTTEGTVYLNGRITYERYK